MKKLIHLIIPISILFWGLGSCFVLSGFLPKPENDYQLLEQMKELQSKKPQKAKELGVHFQVKATEAKIVADAQFKQGMFKFLFGGTLVLFILSIGREYVSYKGTIKNS